MFYNFSEAQSLIFNLLKSCYYVGPCSASVAPCVVKVPVCVSVTRSYLDYDCSLTDRETVKLVEEVVLLIAFAITEIKRLIFIESIIDSIKVCDDK